MSFVNPFWFWGLLALIIPLIIHLWSRQKTRILPFGSLRFLQESSSSQSRSIQLTDVGLMFLRMMLFLLIVLFIVQINWNNKTQNEKWLVLGDEVEVPNAFQNSGYKIYNINDLNSPSTNLNKWYFLQELSQNYPEIDSLIWIDHFHNSDFWGAIPPLSFSFQLFNKADEPAQNTILSTTDSVNYALSGLEEDQEVIFHKILNANELYVNDQVVFEEVQEEHAAILFTNEFKNDIPLQFVFEKSGRKTWRTVENWPYKTIYVSEEYLNDKRLNDELLLLISEQIAQYVVHVWNYNNWQQATNIKREKLDKALISNIVRAKNEVLFWIILVLFLIERFWVYQKRNG